MAKKKSLLEKYWGWPTLGLGAALLFTPAAPLAILLAAAAGVYMLWQAPTTCRVVNRPNKAYADFEDGLCRNTAFGLLRGCRNVSQHSRQKRAVIRQRPFPWWLWKDFRSWLAVAGIAVATGEVLAAGVVLLVV